jgi:hypothetical protein
MHALRDAPRIMCVSDEAVAHKAMRSPCRLVLGNVALFLQAIGIYAILLCTVRQHLLFCLFAQASTGRKGSVLRHFPCRFEQLP